MLGIAYACAQTPHRGQLRLPPLFNPKPAKLESG